MPPIRSISVDKDLIRFTDMKGQEVKLLASDIPKEYDTPQAVEDYLNKVFFPENMGGDKGTVVDPNDGKTYTKGLDYQIKIHVFSINPLEVSYISFNNDVQITGDWWDRSKK